jgi:hypothetical protein
MAITYTNAFKEILNTLKEILYNELKIPVHYDKDYQARASQYLNIKPISSDVISRFSGSSTREYEAEIRYYLQKGNPEKHTTLDYMTDVGERIFRLFNDKTNAVSTNDLFKGIMTNFSASIGTFNQQVAYTFQDGRIEGITYQPSLS